MIDFKTIHDFTEFEKEILNSNRFFIKNEFESFLSAIKSNSKRNLFILKSITSLYRTQIGADGEYYDPKPYNIERMLPFRDKAKEGRANPKGIPYIYLNDDKVTSVAECRPWLYDVVTQITFKSTKDLTLVKFIYDPPKYNFGSGAIKWKPNDRNWSLISRSFTYPIKNTELEAKYVVTQYIAEFIKSIGYDGIIYKSSLGNGNNFCIFDRKNINDVESNVFSVEDINIKIDQIN